MQPKQLSRSLIMGAVLAVLATSGGRARAEVDNFGVGDGHSGAKTVAGTETVNAYAPVTADVAAGAYSVR